MAEGEFDGVRGQMRRTARELLDSGMSKEHVKKKVEGMAARADRNIRAGRQPKPTCDD